MTKTEDRRMHVAASDRRRPTSATASTGGGQDGDDDEDAVDGEENQPEIAAEFSECINVCQTARFKSFQDSKVNRTFQCFFLNKDFT